MARKIPKDYLRCIEQLHARTNRILSTMEHFLREHHYCEHEISSYYFFSGGSRGADVRAELRMKNGTVLAFEGEGDSVEFPSGKKSVTERSGIGTELIRLGVVSAHDVAVGAAATEGDKSGLSSRPLQG